MNKVLLIGRVGKDPETNTTNGGTKVCKFSLATSETYKDKNTGEKKQNTEWHNIVFWGKLAEIAEKYLKKGSHVFVEGKLNYDSYEKDGQTKYFTQIVGKELTMLDKKGDSQSGNYQNTTTSTQRNEDVQSEESDELPF